MVENIDRQAEVYRIKKSQRAYFQRQRLVQNIDKFWYIVLSQHEDFAEYIRPSDYQYFEYLKDVYVQWEVADDYSKTEVNADLEPSIDLESLGGNPGNFSITFQFDTDNAPNIDLESQTITKHFKTVLIPDSEKRQKREALKRNKQQHEARDVQKFGDSHQKQKIAITESEEGEEQEDYDFEDCLESKLISEAVDFKWPTSLQNASLREKRKSFFGFFIWTGNEEDNQFIGGSGPNNVQPLSLANSLVDYKQASGTGGNPGYISSLKFKSPAIQYDDDNFLFGEELARLFADDIFPHAIKYYIETHKDQLEEEMNAEDESEEELDIEVHNSSNGSGHSDSSGSGNGNKNSTRNSTTSSAVEVSVGRLVSVSHRGKENFERKKRKLDV